MKNAEIFQLKKLNAEPLFEGLASGENQSLLGRERFTLDFMPEFPFGWDWELTPLASLWKPPELEGRVSSFNDYPCVNLQVPAFSERAVSVLRSFLEPNGEILPATGNGRNYYLFNCLKVVEILDHCRTIGAFVAPNYSARKGRLSVASSLSVLGVIEEKLKGLSVFSLRELPGQVFVTNQFYERVIDNGLNGFDFVKVWPNPSRTDYLRQHLKQLKAERNHENQFCEQSLAIEFPCWLQASGLQIKQVMQFKKDVLFLLNSTGPNDAFPGRLEAEEMANHVRTFRFICPDCKRLLKRIEPRLIDLDWPVKITVILKDGGHSNGVTEVCF